MNIRDGMALEMSKIAASFAKFFNATRAHSETRILVGGGASDALPFKGFTKQVANSLNADTPCQTKTRHTRDDSFQKYRQKPLEMAIFTRRALGAIVLALVQGNASASVCSCAFRSL